MKPQKIKKSYILNRINILGLDSSATCKSSWWSPCCSSRAALAVPPGAGCTTVTITGASKAALVLGWGKFPCYSGSQETLLIKIVDELTYIFEHLKVSLLWLCVHQFTFSLYFRSNSFLPLHETSQQPRNSSKWLFHIKIRTLAPSASMSAHHSVFYLNFLWLWFWEKK